MWAEEQAAEDELDDGFLNQVLISCNRVLWTDSLYVYKLEAKMLNSCHQILV